MVDYNPPINSCVCDCSSAETRPSHGRKLIGGYRLYQAVPGVQFDISHPILLMREKQERKSLFEVLAFQI